MMNDKFEETPTNREDQRRHRSFLKFITHQSSFSAIHRLLRSWFELTEDEKKALIIILALFLLGVVVRYWHVMAQ